MPTGAEPRCFDFRTAIRSAVRIAAAAWIALLPALLTPTAALAAPAPSRLCVPDEILVQFRPDVTDAGRLRAAREENATLAETITSDGLVRVRLDGGAGAASGAGDPASERARIADAIARWKLRADVEYAAPNLIAHGFFVPNDTLIAKVDWTWNLRTFGAYDAWDVVTADPSIVIAIVDTGVATEDHPVPDYERVGLWPGTTQYRQSPELPGPFLAGWDFIHDDAYPDDDLGHGTKVATIAVGAANNTAGSAGIAFGATILPVKVISYNNDAEMDNIVQGIRFAADRGAQIINLSLGLPPLALLRSGLTEPEIQDLIRPLRSAVNYAQQRGAILVAASGNYKADEVSYPAGFPGVIAVGAAGVDSRRATYSSFGIQLDFLAPGGDFTDLNGDHLQDQIPMLSMKPWRSEGSLAKPDSFIVDFAVGTSGAAPHISGAIALLMTQGVRGQGPIERLLRDSATIPDDIPRSARIEYGNGFVHLDRAVRLAAGGKGSAAAQRAAPGGGLETRVLSGNPARGEALLEFRMAAAGTATARVFDARGRLVRTLFEGQAPKGTSSVRWDGRDGRGAAAPSGVYFLRVDSATGSATRKVAFLR